MMKRIFCALLIALLLPAHVFADGGEGRAFYEPTVLETTELADGRVISRVNLSGFVISSHANNPFHMVNQRCSGTNILTPSHAVPTGYGYCEGLDQDGDMFFISWTNGPDGNTWQLLGGTGKFDGVSGGGTTENLFTWPDGKYVIQWNGNWTMK